MPKKIMIIDDDEAFLRELDELIKSSGYDTVTSNNGVEAFELIKKENPDLILTDLKMDGINGFQLAMLFKKHEKTRNIPIIIMTGYLDDEGSLWLKNTFGTERFLRKPFKPLDVIARIEELTASKI